MAKKKALKIWLPTTPKAAKPKIPEPEKQQVEEKCKTFIEKKKPQWVQPADDKWGYVYDVYGKWYRSYFFSVPPTDTTRQKPLCRKEKQDLPVCSMPDLTNFTCPISATPGNGGRYTEI